MAWVAVDEDGEEYIYSEKPIITDFEGGKYDGGGNGYILLPRGTIEKLTGREHVWGNEPIEL